MPCNTHQIQLKMVELNRSVMSQMKKRMEVVLVIVAACLIFQTRSHINQRDDITYLKNSLSKLYQDFDRSMLTDLASMKQFLESAVKSSKPLIELSEIQKASQKVSHQIEVLQSFEHDKTGRIDLALWNSGGRIAGIEPESVLFYSCNKIFQLIGCPTKRNGPEKLIEPLTQYGEFFRFKGRKATVFIRLFSKALLDAVTIEHIPRKMSPNEEVTSAPRNFSISGMRNMKDKPFLFGNFIFNANKTSIETFEFSKRASFAHSYVKLDFHDNNGHPKETNVYRVRIHGVIDKENSKSKP